MQVIYNANSNPKLMSRQTRFQHKKMLYKYPKHHSLMSPFPSPGQLLNPGERGSHTLENTASISRGRHILAQNPQEVTEILM